MEKRHVRAFLALAEELHFGRAARRLRIAQPAISITIRELEEEIGAVLFDRTRRQVALTDAGHHLRPALQDAIVSIEQGVRAARRAAAGETGRVVIYFTSIPMLSGLPAALATYTTRRPEVQIIAKQVGTRQQLDALREGSCDLALAIMPGEVAPLEAVSMGSEPMVAVVPKGHRVSRARSVRFEEIASEPVLIFPRQSEPAIAEAYEHMCRATNVSPRVAMELQQTEAILAFVAAGLGNTLMPASIKRFGFDGIATVPLVPAIQAGPTLVWDPNRLSTTAAELLSDIRATIGRRRGLTSFR
jgi:LysR family transcriptional regulator, benzoate and cis,cis-muconate-responsive activator of ben and cat genes